MSQYAQVETKSYPSSHSPAELLTEMGVLNLRKAHMEIRAATSQPFSWVNMATVDKPIGPVLNAIQSSEVVNPPRSGHMGGTWTRIAQGGGGSVCLNQVIRQEGLGYPLILDTNQTPSADQQRGDTLYYPGTIFGENGNIELPLYTIDGIPVDRSEPRWTPLVMTEDCGELVPLTTLHRKDMTASGITDARFLSDVMIERESDVRTIFDQLLSRAEMEDNHAIQAQLLGLIANRAITRDGLVVNRKLLYGRDGYRINGLSLTKQELIDNLLLPFIIASDPTLIKSIKITEMPYISKEMLIVLMAVLNTDFYNGKESMTPLNPHIHWGAFQMAGAPPMHDGYFSGSVPGVKTLMQVIRADLSESVPPVYYVLLPAAPFTLWPSADDPQGQEIMSQLIAQVHQETDHLKNKPDPTRDGVKRSVSRWIEDATTQLPDYMISRFSSYDSPKTKALPPSPKMVKPVGFDDLTFRQASMLVGTLMDQVQ